MSNRRLEVSGLSKTFGPARVLRGVGLGVERGELHGLVGQNGCGKSTLVKILTGVYRPDPGGSITVDGRPLGLPVRPAAQREAGVSVVHQNLGLVDDRTVWENVRLGRYRAGRVTRRIDRAHERAEAARVLARLGHPLDVDAPVGRLSAQDRAVAAIARAVQDHQPGSGLVIFDESTRALGREARARFYELVKSLIAEGTSVLLISHQLEEVVEVTDRVTVLRDGEVVAAGVRTAEVDEAEITRLMLGRHLVTHGRVAGHVRDELVADVRGLAAGPVSGFDLAVRRGEIVGLTGLVGSGFAEAAEAIAGARPAASGTMRVLGRELDLTRRRGSTQDFVAAGVAFVPERRLEEGLAGEMSVAENLTLPRVRGRGSALRTGTAWQREESAAMIAKLDIRPPNPQAPISTLSGGNQQKVLLGKWLAGSPDLLVLHEPTQAVDVGARHDIIDAVRRAAQDGCGVLLASIDPSDLAVLCDRVLVVRDGRVAARLEGELEPDAISRAVFGDGDGGDGGDGDAPGAPDVSGAPGANKTSDTSEAGERSGETVER
ncbi:sugar ABC transporter ATP-binding protein [Actinospica durhamensis]|uniref:Sugar ABC transporter ATP-binding protein n=1 Tax=Actinospica durhamensis TaxID=1508375 RepID=A0A941EP45_9ACTN|nr:sugar ABC transporter ATP-binding protein [Actinospica durhamensis]MBR7832599.1 sugar ABC transporter ATP-binding protein [Actinospica durhamensis]